jgi:hypothetical protein
MSVAVTTPGFSDSARYVENSARRGLRSLQESNVFGLDSLVREELATVWNDCRVPNWDGYEALPVTQDTLRNAYSFLETLPLGFPAPSIGAEPDGHLTLEWHRSSRRTLSVSVSPDDELHYAGLFGPSHVYGTEAYFGEVPKSILDLIRRVYSA